MRFDIITIFPNIFTSYFSESILKRAQKKGLIEIGVHDLRQWTTDNHRSVDDSPYGGGPGMVMKVEPIWKAVKHITKLSFPRKRESRSWIPGQARNDRKGKRRVILFSPKHRESNVIPYLPLS